MDDKILISVWVNADIRKKIKETAIREDLTVSSWVRRAINEKVERDIKKNK